MICEGEKGWLQCKPYESLKITKVYWGRENPTTCAKAPAGLVADQNCEANAANSGQKVLEQCEKEEACEVPASNIFFDDNTCGNIYKYLKISYECTADVANSNDALQGGGRRRKKKRHLHEKRSFRDS